MVKKLQAKNEEQTTHIVLNYARQIWLAGLGAFARADTEGNKLFDYLVQEGEKFETRTKKLAGDKVGEVVGVVRSKANVAWDKLEDAFEDRLAQVLNRLGVPTKQDIEALAKQVDALNESVKVLNKA